MNTISSIRLSIWLPIVAIVLSVVLGIALLIHETIHTKDISITLNHKFLSHDLALLKREMD